MKLGMGKNSPAKEDGDALLSFCKVTHASGEEALFYLEGFNWKLDAALTGFFNGSLPPLPHTFSPSEDESFTVSESSPFPSQPSLSSSNLLTLEGPLGLESEDVCEVSSHSTSRAASFGSQSDTREPDIPRDASLLIDKARAENAAMPKTTNALHVEASTKGGTLDQLSAMDTFTGTTTQTRGADGISVEEVADERLQAADNVVSTKAA